MMGPLRGGTGAGNAGIASAGGGQCMAGRTDKTGAEGN